MPVKPTLDIFVRVLKSYRDGKNSHGGFIKYPKALEQASINNKQFINHNKCYGGRSFPDIYGYLKLLF